MSTKPEPSWSLWCDWPDCDYQFESCEFTIFGEGWDPEEIVTDADGHLDRDGKRHYCDHHQTVWASDHENGEPFPEPPYLLIHDGDTDSGDDDGKVSLIEATR